MPQSARIALCLVIVLLAAAGLAEQPSPSPVPNLIRYSGTLKTADGNLTVPPQTVGVTFAIYKQQDGGAPLWQEIQNVTPDANGQYTVLLGTTTAAGLPDDLFSEQEQRWLGIQLQGEAEQPRVQMVSVPYAFKAHDAETLGGLPASAFVKAPPSDGTAGADLSASGTATPTAGADGSTGTSKKGVGIDTVINCTTAKNNYIPLFTSAAPPKFVICNSVMYQANGNIGIGTTDPLVPLHVFNNSSSMAIYGVSTGSSGSTIGVSGESPSSSPSSAGVEGNTTSTTGNTFGVIGQSLSSSGTGVYGVASSTSGSTYGVEGTASSSSGIGVFGNATATSGTAIGVEGQTASSSGIAVAGLATSLSGGTGVYGSTAATSGNEYGVEGVSASSSGSGVFGNATSTSGTTYGLQGQTVSTGSNASGVFGAATATSGNTNGVYGLNASNSGTGVYGSTTSTTGSTHGVEGVTASNSGYGVWGAATSTDASGLATGVYGTSSNGTGVFGVSTATSGSTFGVEGTTATPNGSGVFGMVNLPNGNAVLGLNQATTGPAVGVAGESDGASGIGVLGTGGVGVYGVTGSAAGEAGYFLNSGGGYILVGVAQINGNPRFSVQGDGSGYFAGNLRVDGTLIKGGGSFKIDDPLDPENKYLSHSFVESPDMLNIYNGSVKLDARGEAWVTMPEYFSALNRDFQYVLTAIGRPQPYLYIAKKVSGNRFKIAGGKPNAQVSWQVTGIRQDAWANAYRIPVEEEKPAKERGTYLHPEVFGAGANHSVSARLSQPQSMTQK